jgi:pimeloyl-ACP methyl ester carboxylesterase
VNGEYPLQKQTARLEDGEQISYYSGGDAAGLPVVLLHGGGTDHAMLSWRDTIPALLKAGYRVFAPDYPGYGNSPVSRKPGTLQNLGGYLEQLLDFWAIDRAALIGISMGGALAIGYALEHPERVERMILIGAYGLQDKAPYHALSYFLVKLPWVMDALWAMSRGSRWAARYSLSGILRNPEARTEALVDEVLEAMQNLDSQRAFGQFQRDEILWQGVKTNYSGRLAELTVPVLIVHGEKDFGVPLKYAQRAAALIPNARLEVVENAGHWTQRDDPGRFNQLMLDFLAE